MPIRGMRTFRPRESDGLGSGRYGSLSVGRLGGRTIRRKRFRKAGGYPIEPDGTGEEGGEMERGLGKAGQRPYAKRQLFMN